MKQGIWYVLVDSLSLQAWDRMLNTVLNAVSIELCEWILHIIDWILKSY